MIYLKELLPAIPVFFGINKLLCSTHNMYQLHFSILWIPTMKDRAFQTLYRFALEPIAEVLSDEHSYGFRQGRNVKDAILQLEKYAFTRLSASIPLCNLTLEGLYSLLCVHFI